MPERIAGGRHPKFVQNTISISHQSAASVSSKVEWPLSRFLILLGNCRSDYKFGRGFAAKYCTDLGFKLGPPNFVIEKKREFILFFCASEEILSPS